MDILELNNSLKKQRANLGRMLEAVQKKQRALVSNNYQALEEAIMAEQNALMSIQSAEKERLEIMNGLYTASEVKPESFRIRDYIRQVKGGIDRDKAISLLKLETEIRNTITSITRTNEQNLYLIEHSRAFVRDTLMGVLKAKKKLLDKKI